MATNNVSTFLQTINQGIKPNMFSVDISFPDGATGDAANSPTETKILQTFFVSLLHSQVLTWV